MKKLETLQLICEIYNNYLTDDEFIDRTEESGLNDLLSSATYDTIDDCEYYIANVSDMIFELDNLTEYFLKKISD